MPLSGERKKQAAREWEARRSLALRRLGIALAILEEYGCIWEYERACADEGINEPLLIPEKYRRIA